MLRVEVARSGEHVGFMTFLAGRERPASALSRPVHGLVPQRGDGLTLGGTLDGAQWETNFRPEAGGWWVETTLTAEQPLAFDPSMLLWVGEMDHMDDRQAHTWRQTILRGPTANQQGLGGNDLPACYLYDHAQRIETICYFPPESFAWAAYRFYNFAAREVIQYQPVARYGVGLMSHAPQTALTLPAGTHQLRWWFTQAARDDVPSTWAAQKRLVDSIAPLLDTTPRMPEKAVDWPQIADAALDDLHDDACWVTADGVTGLSAYVHGSSAVARDKAKGFELMTQLDVLWPLMLWREATDSPRADAIIEKVLAALPHFDRPEHHFVANGFPPRSGDTFMDTWYFLENALTRLGWVAYLSGDGRLKEMFRSALTGAGQLFDNTHGLFPLFADASDWQARQSVLNVGVAGMYAAGCVIGAQLLDEPAYLERAKAALTIMHQLPPHMLTHEPQQLTFAAGAAQYLAKNGFGREWLTVAADFVRLSLRMGYWGADPAVPYYDPRGMFQACASLGYPAYKENVEAIMGWPELLSGDADALPVNVMSAFANLQRIHNASFFDPWLPEALRRGPCPHIPYEDLATAEFPHTAKLGKEIYGTGEVFWSALMFGAAHTDAPDVLTLALDVPYLELRRVPRQNRRVLVYNPRAAAVRVAVQGSTSVQHIDLAPQSACIMEGL